MHAEYLVIDQLVEMRERKAISVGSQRFISQWTAFGKLRAQLTAAMFNKSNTLQQYFQAVALPYFLRHSSV